MGQSRRAGPASMGVDAAWPLGGAPEGVAPQGRLTFLSAQRKNCAIWVRTCSIMSPIGIALLLPRRQKGVRFMDDIKEIMIE